MTSGIAWTAYLPQVVLTYASSHIYQSKRAIEFHLIHRLNLLGSNVSTRLGYGTSWSDLRAVSVTCPCTSSSFWIDSELQISPEKGQRLLRTRSGWCLLRMCWALLVRQCCRSLPGYQSTVDWCVVAGVSQVSFETGMIVNFWHFRSQNGQGLPNCTQKRQRVPWKDYFMGQFLVFCVVQGVERFSFAYNHLETSEGLCIRLQ